MGRLFTTIALLTIGASTAYSQADSARVAEILRKHHMTVSHPGIITLDDRKIAADKIPYWFHATLDTSSILHTGYSGGLVYLDAGQDSIAAALSETNPNIYFMVDDTTKIPEQKASKIEDILIQKPVARARVSDIGDKMSNYPNPFNGLTTISIDIPLAGRYKLGVFDILGKEVMQLCDRYVDAGVASWNADFSGLPSGIYLARFEGGVSGESIKATRKLLLLK